MLQRGDIDIGEHKRSGGTRGCGGFLELGIGDGKKGYDGDGTQTVVELPGGEKLLSRRVAEIKEKGLPLLRTFVIDVISHSSHRLEAEDVETLKQAKLSSTYIRQWIVSRQKREG